MRKIAKDRMRDRSLMLVVASVVVMAAGPVHAAIECPRPAQQTATDVAFKVQPAVQIAAQSLPKEFTAQFDARAETITRDLFSQYPNAGNLLLAHSMLSMYCQFLSTSSFSDAQKLDVLYRVEEWVTRVAGVAVPMNKTTGTSCSTDARDVLKPVNAVFNAWAHLDFAEYIQQWSPEAIQRSKFYARKRPDLDMQRRADFRKYSSVTLGRIDPKILFADGTKARITNTYSMRFVRLDGRPIVENGIRESYILECSVTDQKWKIRENNDYELRN